MNNKTWQLQEAKSRLSELVDQALSNGIQTITRHGEPTVVVVSCKEFEKMRKPRERLVDVLLSCPVKDFEVPRMEGILGEPPL